MRLAQKTGEVRVGMGWVCAAVPRVSAAAPSVVICGEGDRNLVKHFLDLAFTRRDARTAFDQLVDLKQFIGHFSDGSYSGLESLSRLQRFIDSSELLSIKSIALDASSAFARIERVATGAAEISQHLMQLSFADGKITDFFCALQR